MFAEYVNPDFSDKVGHCVIRVRIGFCTYGPSSPKRCRCREPPEAPECAFPTISNTKSIPTLPDIAIKTQGKRQRLSNHAQGEYRNTTILKHYSRRPFLPAAILCILRFSAEVLTQIPSEMLFIIPEYMIGTPANLLDRHQQVGVSLVASKLLSLLVNIVEFPLRIQIKDIFRTKSNILQQLWFDTNL